MNNPFQDLLARHASSGTFAVGTFVMSASPIIAEAIGCAGFDWAVVDMEHSPLDLTNLVHTLQALSGTGLVPITRVPWNDPVTVKRVLDAGAQTLLFPFVQDGHEARQAAASCKYPPLGARGMAAMSRGSRFGTVKDYFHKANAAVSVVVQIETPTAIDHLEEIAGVEGIDSIFVGPGDLSGAMGHIGDLTHPAVLEAMTQCVKRCHELGKPIGTVGGTPEVVAAYRQAGFDYVGVASDLGLMMRSCANTLSAIRSRAELNHAQGY
ncbi:HpcH/HpaI aldolase/citrate lyase family protein [Variovorax sp. OV329]|uniref:HpcH/HpaI aldolase family protein n=1 Tax=Variovorax sp. OV329 TaxID=1882825 RepID=UPI0008EB4371|nr:aldolase/citrate lyase family protein [Variovorax sp. OV329]SFN52361.1 2-dehydro-3-deoxyglucarate aldolase [Variovorax sp. OV329]